MPLEDIKRLIKQAADIEVETIKPFWRGEPFVDERMPEILKYAKKCGLKTMINTNGSDPKGIYKNCLPYIDWISFSIDEQHGNISSTSYENIRQAKVNYYIDTEIQASQDNYFVKDFAKDFDIKYKVDLPTKRSETDTESEVISGERKYCKFPHWRIVIAYNGNCAMCCVDWQLENKIGNIYESNLKEIFYGADAENLRFELMNDIYSSDICKQCPSRSAYL
jgi:radical SAM protein with 4Fe4S-binding SPASM domain